MAAKPPKKDIVPLMHKINCQYFPFQESLMINVLRTVYPCSQFLKKIKATMMISQPAGPEPERYLFIVIVSITASNVVVTTSVDIFIIVVTAITYR